MFFCDSQVLDRGPPILNLALLQLMYCVFHHIDLSPSSSVIINADFLKVVAKHVQVRTKGFEAKGFFLNFPPFLRGRVQIGVKLRGF